MNDGARPGAFIAELRSAVIAGISLWLAYASLEFLFFASLPLFLPSGGFRPDMVSPWYWPLAGELLLVYALLGAASGLLLASGARLFGAAIRVHVALTLVLVLAFSLQLAVAASESRLGDGWTLLVSPTLLLVALAASARRPALALLANPLVASLLLLGPLWLARSDVWHGALIGPALVVAVIGSLAWIGGGRERGRLHQAGLPFARSTLFAAIALLILQGCVAGWLRTPDVEMERFADLAQRENRPNVLLVSIDTARADHFSVYGYERETSPRLRDFAKRSIVYAHATAAANHTLPSHASMFTGLYPSWHGAHKRAPADYGQALRPEFDTLAEILRGEGYLTAAVVANVAYLNSGWGMSQGFQVYDDATPLRFLPHPALLRSGIVRLLGRLVPASAFYRITRRAEEVNEVAGAILEHAKESDAPFFLFLNYMDTHRPYLPPPRFVDASEGAADSRSDRTVEEILIDSERKPVTPEELRRVIAHYDAAIGYVDSAIGELLDRLEADALLDDTLVIITSDHGEAFGEHGFFEHGSTPHEEQVHVPLLVKYPGGEGGGTVETRVGHTDLLPTVLEVVGLERRDANQGRSLVDPPVDPQRRVLSESFPSYQGGTPRDVVQRALLQGEWKLILSDDGAAELYRLSEDSAEGVDLHASRPESAALGEALRLWLEQTPGHEGGAEATGSDLSERLKSLGYIQ